VERQDLARVQAHVSLFDETNFVATEDSQPATAPDVLEEDVDLCRVNALRLRTGETQQQGLVGAVPATCGPQGAEEFDLDAIDGGQLVLAAEAQPEQPGCPHGSDGVRA